MLVRVAYRMLGSVADAEDVTQEAFLKWRDVDPAEVREPEGYLRRIVTRLCLDELRSARRRRETYTGTWLPEPVVEAEPPDDVTLPLLLALERLSPLERAAFLLHDVFGVEFDEIAATLGRGPATCRQLASRARRNVRASRPRFPLSKEHGLEIAAAFFAASRQGDMDRLRGLLAEGVTVYADGGGKIPAALHPISGLDAVVRFQEALAGYFAKSMSRLVQYAFINGLPGFITVERGDVVQTTALEIHEGRIAAVYVVRNPDKLRHLPDASPQ
jgi:RNA polymerase sigma-70 factor (ECF subfamily)